MKIMLINPPLYGNTARRLGPIADSLFYNSAPLGLCYLAAVLEKEKHDVRIVDAAVEGLSIEKIISLITDFSPAMIGVTTFTVSAYSAYMLAKEIRKKNPAVRIIMGGPHITSNPEDILKNPDIDIAVIGEGEVTFKELAEAVENNRDIRGIKGLAYNEGGKLFFTPPREFIRDLDVLPYPARHLVPLHLYKPQPNDQKRLPKLSMLSSRGCPYPCIFCDKNVFKNLYRSFSPEYIAGEMAHLVKNYGVKDIAFVDSTFTPGKDRVYGIISEIRKLNLDITWTCSVRADILDKELLREMKRAGCWRVRIGIESGNEDVLRFIKKGITKSQVKKAARWAYELDLEPKAFFMVGHLIDTKETIEESINFACGLPLKDITVQLNTPLKNTAQYDLCGKYGRFMTGDLSKYSFWQPVFTPHGLSDEDVRYYYRKFYLKFYLRPVIWYRHMVKIRTLNDVIKYLRGMKIIFFFLISCLKKKS
jgi:anaerobic magnesium-protoporphyrin IX monomethyl ester cyclase